MVNGVLTLFRRFGQERLRCELRRKPVLQHAFTTMTIPRSSVIHYFDRIKSTARTKSDIRITHVMLWFVAEALEPSAI